MEEEEEEEEEEVKRRKRRRERRQAVPTEMKRAFTCRGSSRWRSLREVGGWVGGWVGLVNEEEEEELRMSRDATCRGSRSTDLPIYPPTDPSTYLMDAGSQ